MQFVIRATKLCNFQCEFCSNVNISKDTTPLDITYLKGLFLKYKPETVCFEGGDPLMLSPNYYREIMQFTKIYDIEVKDWAFITNLWAFYRNPEKWVDLFSEPNVSLGTSFQYGTKRKISKTRIYDEKTFREVYQLVQTLINKPLGFNAVIDRENYDRGLDHVLLAKDLGTSCKLLPLDALGRSKDFLPQADFLALILKIVKSGLSEYEWTSSAILDVLRGEHTGSCPFNRECGKDFIVINPDGSIKTCSLDHSEKPIHFQTSVKQINQPNCLTCSAFDICNGCYALLQQNRTKEDCEKIIEIVDELKAYA